MGQGVRVYPLTKDRHKAILQIERESFDGAKDDLRVWIAKSQRPRTDVFVDVAVDAGDAVVGFVVWSALEEEGPKGYQSVSVLLLAVALELRGQRIGERLLSWVRRRSQNMFPQAALMSLHVRTDNSSALRLYERFGFSPACVLDGFYGNCDAYYMVLGLDETQGQQELGRW
mmetsp:Transcript_122851/g.382475  ORF Transcript_122851/g.382475 Transcript_122851/m.382475 type:complete len:172 (+) Transcript_122851:721-1236(+)